MRASNSCPDRQQQHSHPNILLQIDSFDCESRWWSSSAVVPKLTVWYSSIVTCSLSSSSSTATEGTFILRTGCNIMDICTTQQPFKSRKRATDPANGRIEVKSLRTWSLKLQPPQFTHSTPSGTILTCRLVGRFYFHFNGRLD